MQQTRNDRGDFILTGTVEEQEKLRDGLAAAFGADDELAVELTELIDGSGSATIQFTLEREIVAEIADYMVEDDDVEISRVGEEIQAEIERLNAEAIAAFESENDGA